MTIDFTKPVQTRDGQPVTILTTKRDSDNYPVVGMISNTDVHVFTTDGKYLYGGNDYHLDLVNVTVKHEAWINIHHHKDGSPWSCSYKTKEQADYCVGTGRIACVRVEYEKGDGL